MCISPGMKTSMHPAHKTEGWEAQSHCCLDPASLPQKELRQRQLKSRGSPMAKAVLFHSLLELVPSYSLLFF